MYCWFILMKLDCKKKFNCNFLCLGCNFTYKYFWIFFQFLRPIKASKERKYGWLFTNRNFVMLNNILLPPEGIELSTPGLRDQCSASELRRLAKDDFINFNFFQSKFVLYKMFWIWFCVFLVQLMHLKSWVEFWIVCYKTTQFTRTSSVAWWIHWD